MHIISFAFGIVAAFDLLIKPSTIIFFIALLGMMAFNLRNIVSKIKRCFIYGIVFLIAFIMISTGFKTIENDNLGIKINSNLTFSMIHFAAMGIHGTGGITIKMLLKIKKLRILLNVMKALNIVEKNDLIKWELQVI